ncbi:MAG TPA: universal stress protein [Longimicrobiales bacterium]|nr:universal stress protein [Longimicrobiales bacterium]
MAGEVGPVVVGTDFSDTAGVALAEARRLAALLRTEVVVVHVADGAVAADAGYLQGSGHLPDPGRPPATESAAEGWLRLAGLPADEMVIRTGSAWVELARYAAEVEPSLVVVGSHGQSGYQPLHIGSTASRVSMNARCPVVVVSPRVVRGAPESQDMTWREQGTQEQQQPYDAVRADAAAGARVGPGNQSGTGETR